MDELNETLARAALSIARRDRRKLNLLAKRTLKHLTSIPLRDLPTGLREGHRQATAHLLLVALVSDSSVADYIACLSTETDLFGPMEVLQRALSMVGGALGRASPKES